MAQKRKTAKTQINHLMHLILRYAQLCKCVIFSRRYCLFTKSLEEAKNEIARLRQLAVENKGKPLTTIPESKEEGKSYLSILICS